MKQKNSNCITRASSSKQKLRIGILGIGRGMTHLQNFLNVAEAEVIAIADRLPNLRSAAEEVMRKYGNKGKILAEYDDLLHMRPDVVVVASNACLQCRHTVQALEAGCHVFSEVPGALSLAEWLKIRDAVERTGRQYMMAENLCFMDFIRYWRRWIEEGRYGEVTIAEAEYIHYLPETMTNAAGEFFTPTQIKERGLTDVNPTWRADLPPIGYLTHDLGPLLEVLDDRVVSVSCRSAGWRCKEAPLRSDGQIALFHTAKGNLIQIMVTLNTRRPSEHNFRMFGVEGGLEWTSYEQFCRRFDKQRTESDGWEVVDIGMAARNVDTTTGHGGTDFLMAQLFTRCLLKNGTVPIDVYRSIEYSLPGIIAAQSADLGGAPVSVPDLRRQSFTHTDFWKIVGLPKEEPKGRRFQTVPPEATEDMMRFTDYVHTPLVSKIFPHAPLTTLSYPKNKKEFGLKSRSFGGNFLDLHAELEKAGAAVVYYVGNIRCTAAMKLNLLFSYDGPVKVWIDGREIYCDPHGTVPCQFTPKATIPFSPAKGMHEILVALDSNDGTAHGIWLRFERLDLSPRMIEEMISTPHLPKIF